MANVNERQVSGQAVHNPKLRQDKAKPSERLRGVEKKISKSKLRMDRSSTKLDHAKGKLAAKKPVKKPGAVKTAGRAAKAEAVHYAHHKIFQVEDDNVGVKAAHRTERVTEGAVRDTSRYVKHRSRTRPARQVDKLQKQNIRAKADFHYRSMVHDNPELKKNAVTKHFQKKRIQKQYQKQAKEAAKKTAKKTADKAASAIEKTANAVGAFFKRHPKGAILALLLFFLILILQSCVGSMLSIFNSLGGGVAAGTYPSEDMEMILAEAAYSGKEAVLRYELNNYSKLHGGYDEYHFDLDTLQHDPYVLISILSAIHQGAWTIDDVQGTLSLLFERHYILTETVIVEVRYTTETVTTTDPETGETSEETVDVAYDYYICYVTLDNFNLSHLPIYIMGEQQLSMYAMYMSTLGNRPDLFPQYLYPNASVIKDYGRYDIPPEYLEDAVFAAMIKEAEKYLGFPYIWGGYSPATSFDCSGFVSWVINHSGWNVGRLDAQGLYNICTPVTAANARPGDLVFFTGTYDTPGISHVGLYVGDGMMIHAGNPIGYVSINDSYSQFPCYYGRLP